MDTDDKQFDQLPHGLVDRLRAEDKAVPVITARADREIARMAQAHFAQRRRSSRARPAWIATAATVLVALFLTVWLQPADEQAPPVYADVDGSGQIDIADVLALARNRGAGQLTQAELDAFAMRVVSLDFDGDAS